jgi:hypothetical protein
MFNNQGKTLVLSVIILLLVAILLAVTNPDRESHHQAIKNKLTQKDTITNVLNRGILAVNPPEYHTKAVISYTKYNNEIATLGIVGYVWVNEKVFK